MAAAAQREVFAAGALAELDTLEDDATPYPVRPIARDLHFSLATKAVVPDSFLLPRERTRWTLTNHAHDILDGRPVGIDPGLGAHAPHLWQSRGAVARVRTDAAVVEDLQPGPGVRVKPIGRPVIGLPVVESDGGVGTVAKGLGLR